MDEQLNRSMTEQQIFRSLDTMPQWDRKLIILDLVRKAVRDNPPFMKDVIDALLLGTYQKIDELREHAQIAECGLYAEGKAHNSGNAGKRGLSI